MECMHSLLQAWHDITLQSNLPVGHGDKPLMQFPLPRNIVLLLSCYVWLCKLYHLLVYPQVPTLMLFLRLRHKKALFFFLYRMADDEFVMVSPAASGNGGESSAADKDTETESNISTTPLTSRKSPAWAYFTIKGDNKDWVTCDTCGIIVTC